MGVRQQSATEFVSIYSFAIFVISVMLVVAATVSSAVGSSTAPIYSSCSIQPLIPCQQSLLTYNSANGGYFTYVLEFRNNLGFLLFFPTVNAINLTASELAAGAHTNTMGTCNPLLAVQGSQVVCVVTINGIKQVNVGANTYTQFRLYYSLCTNQSVASCGPSNAVYSAPLSSLYSATGYSFQTLSGPYNNLYMIGVTSPNGIVVINGQPYLTNALVYLTSGSYLLYAQPNVGYTFNSWSVSGTGISISTNSLANTILTVGSNGNVIENSH